MPGKGQTCLTCQTVACCRGLKIRLPPLLRRVRKDNRAAVKRLLEGMSARQILKLGGEFVFDPELQREYRCPHLNEQNRCQLEIEGGRQAKPRLCRSYYCHGKYWRGSGNQDA